MSTIIIITPIPQQNRQTGGPSYTVEISGDQAFCELKAASDTILSKMATMGEEPCD